MMYNLTDYQGNVIGNLPAEKAAAAAGVAELIEIEVNGQIHYINPKNIASIKPAPTQSSDDFSFRKAVPGVDYGKLSSGK